MLASLKKKIYTQIENDFGVTNNGRIFTLFSKEYIEKARREKTYKIKHHLH